MRRPSSGFRRTRAGTSFSRGGTGTVPYMVGRRQMSFNDLSYGVNGYSNWVPMINDGVVVNALSEDSSSFTAGGNIGQGTGIQSFLGNKFYNKYMIIRGVVALPVSAGAGSGFIALVYDKRPRGVLPVFGDIFGTAVPNPGFSLQRMDTMDRFSILWRRDFNCESTGTYNGLTPALPPPSGAITGVNTSSTQHTINACVSLRNLPTRVIGTQVTSATIANIDTGAIYMVFQSTGFAGVNPDPAPWASSTCLFAKLVTRICFTSV